MEKFLVTIEFRFKDAPKFEDDYSSKSKTVTIGVFDSFEDAANEGNKSLEIFEKHFDLNPHWERKERFSKSGGVFGSENNLITNTTYLQTPFSFYAKIQTLKYFNLEETILEVIEAEKRYKKFDD